ITAFDLFQKHHVKTIAHPPKLPGGCLRKVNNTNKGMQRFIPVKGIILVDRIEFQYLVHSWFSFPFKITCSEFNIHSDWTQSVKMVGKPVICISALALVYDTFVVLKSQ